MRLVRRLDDMSCEEPEGEGRGMVIVDISLGEGAAIASQGTAKSKVSKQVVASEDIGRVETYTR
jgi:hypothetical protein